MALKKNKEGNIKDTIVNKKKLKEKAWNVFSLWIRNRDKKCVSCGIQFWNEQLGEFGVKGLQGGHFHHAVLDFDEENINAQCSQCNHYKSGNLAKYSLYLLNKLGEERFKKLGIRASMAQKGKLHNIEYYQHIIDQYKLSTPDY